MSKTRAPIRRRKGKQADSARGASATPTLPVTGNGETTGGLEALSAFLKVLPVRKGLAVVVIQHLAPEFEKALPELMESAAQAIVVAGPDGKVELINQAAEKLFDLHPDKLVGQSVDVLLPPGVPAEAPFPLEVQLQHPDQAAVALKVAFLADIDEHRRLEEVAENYRAEIRALAEQLITVQEEERRRVSRELHDGLCQKLAHLAFDIQNLMIALPKPPETRDRLRELRERAVAVAEEARNLAYELHPSMLDDLGLVASLKTLCAEFRKEEKVRVRFTAGKLPDAIPQRVASGLYRIAQECMQNVAKHAKAKHLAVDLTAGAHTLLLTLKDDGAGFQAEAVSGKGGLGLVSIRERVRMLTGDLTIDSKPGHGALISVRVPFH